MRQLPWSPFEVAYLIYQYWRIEYGTISRKDAVSDISRRLRNSFLMGAAIGAACTVGFAAIGKIVGSAGKGDSKLAQKTKPGKWLANKLQHAGEKASAFIGKHRVTLGNDKIENILNPKSIHEAARDAMKTVNERETAKKVLRESINQLPSDNNKNFNYTDMNNNTIKKSDLLNTDGEGLLNPSKNCEKQLKEVLDKHNVDSLKITKGDLDLSSLSEYTFTPNKGIGQNRNANMTEYYKQIAEDFNKGVPDSINKLMKMENINIKEFNSTNVKELLKKTKLTLHETSNGEVQLIDSYVHSKISHFGGVGVAKMREMITNSVKSIGALCSTKATKVYGSLIGAMG